jgi:hypothetical protein
MHFADEELPRIPVIGESSRTSGWLVNEKMKRVSLKEHLLNDVFGLLALFERGMEALGGRWSE